MNRKGKLFLAILIPVLIIALLASMHLIGHSWQTILEAVKRMHGG